MNIKYENVTRLVPSVLVAAALTVNSASAQERDLVIEEDAIPAVRAQELNRLFLGPQGLNRLRDLRVRFESALRSRIKDLDRLPDVSEAQKKKLALAGRVDIERYVDRLQDFENKLAMRGNDRAELVKVFQEIEGLQRLASQDLFGDGSYYTKVLARTLTDRQIARLKEIERKMALERHDGTLRWVLETWDQALKLSADQRQRLDLLLHEQTRPPRKYGEYDYYGVLLQLSRLPEPTLKMHFSDAQWALVSKHMDAARGLEETLKKGGYLPKDDVAAAPSRPDLPPVKPENKRG